MGIIIFPIFLLMIALLLLILIVLVIIMTGDIRKKSPLDLEGEVCIVVEDLSPEKWGWVRVRGELWRARSLRSVMKKGERGIVIKVALDHLIVEKTPTPMPPGLKMFGNANYQRFFRI